jgi:hypothetical protein
VLDGIICTNLCLCVVFKFCINVVKKNFVIFSIV